MEQKLEIKTNESKGTIYKNIYPKVFGANPGLDIGNHIVFEKLFLEGTKIVGKYGDMFGCKVKYGDEEVSFILNLKDHEAFKKVGGVGDMVKMTLIEEARMNNFTKKKTLYPILVFEKI